MKDLVDESADAPLLPINIREEMNCLWAVEKDIRMNSDSDQATPLKFIMMKGNKVHLLVHNPFKPLEGFEEKEVMSLAVRMLSMVLLKDLTEAGFPEEIVDGIESVTKRSGESFLDFVLRSKANPVGNRVKQEYILDNTADFPCNNKEQQRREKYLLALHVLRS